MLLQAPCKQLRRPRFRLQCSAHTLYACAPRQKTSPLVTSFNRLLNRNDALQFIVDVSLNDCVEIVIALETHCVGTCGRKIAWP